MARHMTARKEKQWAGIPSIEIDLSTFGTFSGVSLAFSSKQTVLRMLGEYLITSRSTLANNDQAFVGVGIGKVSTDAFNVAAAAALPDPISEPEYPWLYWASHPFQATGTAADNGDQSLNIAHRQSFDIRSQRKFSPGESLVMVVQAVDLAGAMPLTIVLAGVRVLVTVH